MQLEHEQHANSESRALRHHHFLDILLLHARLKFFLKIFVTLLPLLM